MVGFSETTTAGGFLFLSFRLHWKGEGNVGDMSSFFSLRSNRNLNMGNNVGPRMKIGKTLTDENVAELATLSGFTPDQVREWHTGFLVSPCVGLFP